MIKKGNSLLRPEHYQAGFLCLMDSESTTITYKGEVWRHYGINTPMALIHQEIDQVVELSKSVTIDRQCQSEREDIQMMREASRYGHKPPYASSEAAHGYEEK